MDKSRFPNFYQMPIKERIEAVFERGLITEDDFQALKNQQQRLDIETADKMIENVIGVLGMPIGLGLNFSINKMTNFFHASPMLSPWLLRNLQS